MEHFANPLHTLEVPLMLHVTSVFQFLSSRLSDVRILAVFRRLVFRAAGTRRESAACHIQTTRKSSIGPYTFLPQIHGYVRLHLTRRILLQWTGLIYTIATLTYIKQVANPNLVCMRRGSQCSKYAIHYHLAVSLGVQQVYRSTSFLQQNIHHKYPQVTAVFVR